MLNNIQNNLIEEFFMDTTYSDVSPSFNSLSFTYEKPPKIHFHIFVQGPLQKVNSKG